MENAMTTTASPTVVAKRCGLFGSTGTGVPVPPSDGGFQPGSLQRFGFVSRDGLLSALNQQRACAASLCVLPLAEAAAADSGSRDEKTAGHCCSPLGAFAAGEEGATMGGQEEAWELLRQTSSWGPSMCGRVVASSSSWDIPANDPRSVSSQIRLALFLGLRAVLVPLPECGDDGNDVTPAFTAAVSVLAQRIRETRTTYFWVYCDASSQAHRVVFSRLRTALMWGESIPSLSEAAGGVSREVLRRVLPYLWFSETFGALPSEWLGEPVVAFEVPHVDKITHAFRYDSVNLQMCFSELPSDILPLVNSYWATVQPPFISLGAFILELLRRRAMPIFPRIGFLQSYGIMNQLYEGFVHDDGRDTFEGFEDTLQLPLQPLGHMLASGVYEVFEQDSAKYRQYRTAMFHFFSDWLRCREERSHGKMWSQIIKENNGEADDDRMNFVHVILLGAGRGPLIGECLDAASALDIRVHLFALDKNPEAVDFVRLRLSTDPQWRYFTRDCGHVVETICADGRAVEATINNNKGILPKYWGLCDLVVSELLGSFGDNELSPECLDAFYEDFRRYQTSVGIPVNPFMTSIPQEYTAWIAPLYSGGMEESVADAAVSGLTVLPSPCCHDRRAAIYHSMFVCNVCRAISLAAPQPCWTFRHFTETVQKKEREAFLTFRTNIGGRCSGFIGYFSAVLYASTSMYAGSRGGVGHDVDEAVTTLATVPEGRTRGMFSWFPCFFAIEPRDVMEVQPGDKVQLHMRRCVSCENGGRVWYGYDATHLQEPGGNVKKTASINDGGWAASILLPS